MVHSETMSVNAPAALFDHLVHDAALYPPGSAPMEIAVAEHLLWRADSRGRVVGPFLCPSARLAEMQGFLPEVASFDIALLAGDASELVDGYRASQSDERLAISHLEVVLPAGNPAGALASVLRSLPAIETYVEIPRAPGWEEALDLLASTRHGAKLRTGGLTAEAFPTEEEVASFLHASFERRLSAKLTAGLHRAARHCDPVTGFEHHGFLNVVLAACGIVDGAGIPETVDVLAERDPETLAAALISTTPPVAERARGLFVGYGSCSLGEPYEELRALSLVRSDR